MKELPFRQIHIDFHTSPYILEVGNGFNEEEFVATLSKARVNAVILFAKCHHGMYYYPTKLGTMHPGLKFDLLGAELEACRKAHIGTCIYTCVSWNEEWADRHPEWLEVSHEGILGQKKPFSTDYTTWRCLCLNNREHIQYIKEEFQETYNRFHPERYWIDIIFQKGCICKACMAEMKQSGLNPADLQDVRKHDRMVEIKFMKEIYEFLTQMDQNLGIYFNGYAFNMDLANDEELSSAQKRKYNNHLFIESLPSDMWGYTHFPICANYLNPANGDITMMNGKFHKAWGDFGSLRNLEALEYECFRAIANGAKCCIGDQLHPSGELEPSVYERIGKVYQSIESKEEWLFDTRKVAQIGVYASNRVLEDIGVSSEGAYRIMTELHYLFDFIDFRTELGKYDLLILPDQVILPPQAAAKIKTYMADGGKVLLTGESGLDERKERFVLEEFGVELISGAEYNPRYLHITPENFPAIPPMDYVVYEKGLKIGALNGTNVLAYITNPYFNRTYDRFCSHRQTPPAAISTEPGIVSNGKAIYISNPLFKDYAISGCKVYKDILKRCIENLLDEPLVLADLPSTAEITLRKQNNRYILHVLNYIIQRKCKELDTIEEKWPLYHQCFKVRTEKVPQKIYLAPQLAGLDFRHDGVYAEFEVPEICGHQMIVIES
jgi:hypothetical protein